MGYGGGGGEGGGEGGGGGEGDYIAIATLSVTTRIIPALRWAAVRAI